MQCHQCPRPAFCTLRDKASDEVVSLCLSCWHELQEANFRSFLLNTAMVNPSRLSKLAAAEERSQGQRRSRQGQREETARCHRRVRQANGAFPW
jgi:hypothetical protein